MTPATVNIGIAVRRRLFSVCGKDLAPGVNDLDDDRFTETAMRYASAPSGIAPIPLVLAQAAPSHGQDTRFNGGSMRRC